MRDLAHSIKTVPCVPPALYTADQTGATVDRLDFDSLTFVIAIGAGGITFTGTNKIEFVAAESDDGSTWTPIAAGDLILDSLAPVTIAGGIVRALVAAKAAADVQRVGYVGTKRYARISPDFSGTHGTGTGISVTAVLGHPMSAPVA